MKHSLQTPAPWEVHNDAKARRAAKRARKLHSIN